MGICTKRSCTLALATACLQDLTPNQLIIIGPENFPTWGRAIFALCLQISGLCQALNDILDSMSSKGIAIPVWVKSSRPGGGWYLSELLHRLQNWHSVQFAAANACHVVLLEPIFYHTFVWCKFWATALVQVPSSGCSWVRRLNASLGKPCAVRVDWKLKLLTYSSGGHLWFGILYGFLFLYRRSSHHPYLGHPSVASRTVGCQPALTNNGFESGFHICNAAYHFNCNLQGTTISTQREAYLLIYGAVHTCGIMPLNKSSKHVQ